MNEILLVTDQYDMQADNLVEELARRNMKFIRFHPWDFPLQTHISINCSNGDVTGCVRDTMFDFNAANIKSVWYRGVKETRLHEGLNEDERRFAAAQVRETLRGLFSITSGMWVNDPVLQPQANLKIKQLQVARELGLNIPKTIISNDPKAILEFYDQCSDKVIYKTLAQVIWRIGASVFSTPVPKETVKSNPDLISRAPCIFQEYIEKKLELRITIFGKKILAAAVYSQELEKARYDWRIGSDSVRIEPFILPGELEVKLLKMMEKFGIVYGAVDMIITPQDEYVFLEINPQGQFGWLQEKTGMKFYSALADLLEAGKV